MTINWQIDVIPEVKRLLNDYEYAPTVRAMFYRLVSENIIPNTYDKYKGLIQALSTAREKSPKDKGYISVYSFADDTRHIEDINDEFWTYEQYVDELVHRLKHADEDYFNETYRSSINNDDYINSGYLTRWHKQPKYTEIMIEKDALRGTFRYVLSDKQVRIVPNRGWSSKIYKRRNIDRLLRYRHGYNGEGPKEVRVLYFGDYDPSGIRMSKNIGRELESLGIHFERVGLNHNHISDYGLDHLRNPDPDVRAKLRKDPNRHKFMAENNGELFQIELDAVLKNPQQFSDLVLDSVNEYYDESINEENLRESTPKKVDNYVKTKVRFLT